MSPGRDANPIHISGLCRHAAKRTHSALHAPAGLNLSLTPRMHLRGAGLQSLVIIVLPCVFNLATAKEQNVTEKRYVIALKP